MWAVAIRHCVTWSVTFDEKPSVNLVTLIFSESVQLTVTLLHVVSDTVRATAAHGTELTASKQICCVVQGMCSSTMPST